MKKIILLLFLFFSILCFFCYYIYIKTEDTTKHITVIGDNIANNPYFINSKGYYYNNDFINKDIRINDLLNIITYNKELADNKSIHQILKNTNILIISIGMNDLYYKLNSDTKEIYTYINDMINNYELILNEISKYNYDKVYILGYYNIFKNKNDIFTYINYKTNKLVNKYHYVYINMDKLSKNEPKILKKQASIELSNTGYYQIYKIILENLKKSWYNIKCIYYYDLY